MLLRSAGRALVVAGGGGLPTPAEDTGSARRRATGILARPEFRRPPKSLVQRFWDWLTDVAVRVLDGIGTGSAVVGWVVVLAVGALVTVTVVVVLRHLQRDPRRPDGLLVVDEVGRPADDWRVDAARHEAAGAHREALRCHWRALVADLASRGLVEEVPGRTTGEYRRRVARSVPGGATPFAEATGLFEVAWYAAAPVAAEDVERARRLGERVLAEARR